MTHRIACNLADRVAAVGIVDGFDSGMLRECYPARPVPVMAFFGRADPLAGADYPKWFLKLINVTIDETEPPLPADAIAIWLENWATRDGCNLSPMHMPPLGNVSETRYEKCHNDAAVVLYSIAGQGHAWPGGPALPLLGDSVSDINASETLWDFSRQHPLNGNPP